MTGQQSERDAMTEADFDREYGDIESARQASQEGAQTSEANCDRRLATLLQRSGWTHRRIAGRVKKSQHWVMSQIRFANFLKASCFQDSITEGRFRDMWKQTDQSQSDEERFAEVARMLAEESNGVKKAKRGRICNTAARLFSGAGWKTASEIADGVGGELGEDVSPLQVCHSLGRNELKPNRSFRYIIDRSQHTCPARAKFRIRDAKVLTKRNALDVAKATEQLRPLLADIVAECKKGRTSISLSHLAAQASKLERLLRETIIPLLGDDETPGRDV